MVNNFDIARGFMTFDSADDFYFIQVIVRGKDGHAVSGNNKNRTIKYYTIRSIDEFNRAESEIKHLCEHFGARAYIHYSRRSFEQMGKEMLRVVTDNLLSENWQGMKSAFQHCCGSCVPKKHKTYLVDIDWEENEDCEDRLLRCSRYQNYINFSCENIEDKNKVLGVIPTNSGCHLICRPFNINKFRNKFPHIEVKQNNPTLLYKA